MIRILLVIAVMVFGPMQAVASDAAKLGGGGDAAIVAVLFTADLPSETGDGKCCHETDIAEQKTSFCKPDIKAVVEAGGDAALSHTPEHDRPYLSGDTSFKKPVDLRPPIS